MIVAASAAAAPLISETLTIASPSANAAPMIHMIASIHGDVIRSGCTVLRAMQLLYGVLELKLSEMF
jgi:hypothetical protein